MLGLSSRLTLGGSLGAAFREPDSLKCITEAFQGVPGEWTARRNPRVLRLRAIPFASPSEEGGSDTWVLVTLDDITHQEALETTRQKFISNAGHELKTPTTSMRIAAEDLLEGNLVLPEGETDLRIILRSVDRMTMLLEDISELSRIETGALRLDPQPVTIGSILAGLREDFRAQATQRNITLAFGAEGDLEEHTIMADPLRLRQLLENLLSNAIKFSPAASEVALKVVREGPWLTWAVSDQGMGISSQDLPRIFERFYRAPAARAVPGTGLGLAIVKHLAVLMEGEVDLRSTLGEGSTFTLRLPFGAGEPAHPRIPVAPPRPFSTRSTARIHA
jgi:two-component system phosphate regulon sensor histidine kinase PhoR